MNEVNGLALSIDCAAYLRNPLVACISMDTCNEYSKMFNWNRASSIKGKRERVLHIDW